MKSKQTNYEFFITYIKPYFSIYLLSLVLMMLHIALWSRIPLVLRTAIDYITARFQDKVYELPAFVTRFFDNPTPTQALLFIGAVLCVLTLFEGFLWAGAKILSHSLSLKIEYNLRNDFTSQLQKMSPEFYQKHKTGELMSRATSDIQAFSSLFGNGIYQPLNIIFTVLVTFVTMSRINMQITLLALVPLPFTILLTYWMIRRIKILVEKRQKQHAKLTATAQENFSGMRTIKSYAREGFEISRFVRENKKLVKRNLALSKIDAWFDFGIDILFEAGFVMVLLIGGTFVIQTKITLGEMVALLAYIEAITWPMVALGWILNMWQRGLVSATRLRDIFNLIPRIRDDEHTKKYIKHIQGEIEFKNISFSYPGSKHHVIENFSLRIQPGTTCAIVGPTGAGKTTLVNFIPRLLEPDSGEIRIDGHKIHEIPLQVLRQNIGYVQQDHFLFSETLLANIAFGVVEEQEKQILNAVESSQLIRDLDQFPQGLETMIGERGITLSGGQQQRTSIARAIIRNPAILILDDSLSSVDTQTEEKIFQRIKPMMEKRTTLIISHRISTIRDADQIVYIENGSIKEHGTHAELIQQNGHYARMFKRQQLEDALKQGLA